MTLLNNLLNQPKYVLMRGLARFATIRWLVVSARRLLHVGRKAKFLSDCESRIDATHFPAIDRSGFVETLKNRGVSFGLTLSPAIVNGIHQFARTTPCYADRDGAAGFMAESRADADVSLGKPILLAQYFNAVTECPEISLLASDPVLQSIACEYLGSIPTFGGANLWWTFPVDALDSDREWHAHLFHRDVDDFRFLKFFFYLTGIVPGDGGHVCVVGSHVQSLGASVSDRWKLRRYSDDEISRRFPSEEIYEICGEAGTGFAENTFCLHKGLTPKKDPRLLLQLQFSLFDYGVMHDQRNSEQLHLIRSANETR